ncbi:MAG: gluconate transporter [Paraglaciecola sp.]|jgi:gluconate transporter
MPLATQLLIAICTGIALLLFLIIRLKLNAFLALLIASIWIGLLGGISPSSIGDVITKGMGDTLGFVATIVGLGSIFGAILEHTGGAHQLSQNLLRRTGENNARLAMLSSGFIIAIPVFFDVAFIILFPVIRAISQRTRKPLLTYALPLLTGIAITHSFIPPTPGPVAVADILNVDLGWMIGLGILVGLPVSIVAGLWFSKFLSFRTSIDDELSSLDNIPSSDSPSTDLVVITNVAILLPLLLMVLQAVLKTLLASQAVAPFPGHELILFIGHPFSALLIATLFALYFLGKKANLSRETLTTISAKALAPAGTIILITGAGGVLKQMLITTGIGGLIADSVAASSISIIFLAYLVSALVRILQGSATIAMITGAGIIAPVLEMMPETGMADRTLLALAIAAGSVIASHVNDSGFWLVNRYLKQEVKETLSSWTVLSTVISISSFLMIVLVSLFL